MPPIEDDDDLKLPADEKDPPNGKESQDSDDEQEGDGDADAEGSEDQGQDDEDGDGAEGQEELAARKSRSSNDIARLRAERREEKARADRLERDVAQLRAERESDRARQAETPEQEAARLALMTPEERIDYKLAKAEQANARFMQQQNFIAADQNDQMQYNKKALTDPRFAKYADEVEAKLAEARKTGGNPSREVVLKYLLGEKLLASKKSDKAKKAADDNVRRQTTSPPNSKGDLPSGGRKQTSLAKRLENVAL